MKYEILDVEKLKKKLLIKLKKCSILNNIPIVKDETLFFLQKIIKKNKLINILEIGTAIGYSALGMNNHLNNIQTIERDFNKYKLALNFFKNYNFKIDFILSEAFFYQPKKKYDLIFIDAAKAQYQKLFNKYNFFLKKKGIIICDNINYFNNSISLKKSRSTKRIIKKINDFKFFLEKNIFFKTIFLNIGDGISISTKYF
jgi:predicted O-methyltransferase YrrM